MEADRERRAAVIVGEENDSEHESGRGTGPLRGGTEIRSVRSSSECIYRIRQTMAFQRFGGFQKHIYSSRLGQILMY